MMWGERWTDRTCESSYGVMRLGSCESHDRMERSGTKEKRLTATVTVGGSLVSAKRTTTTFCHIWWFLSQR